MPKFLNIAVDAKTQPSLVNIDKVVRIHPGGCSSPLTGRDDQCCIIFATQEEIEYDDNRNYNEPYAIDVHLPVREIVRRIMQELLVV